MKLKVLAIDNSHTMRELIRHTLESADISVTTANDGCDGVAKFGEVRPDVVVTDLNMPNMNGFGVIEELRKPGAESYVPVLVLSTESSADLKDRARRSGATGWIVKPFDAERLVSAIRRVAKVQT